MTDVTYHENEVANLLVEQHVLTQKLATLALTIVEHKMVIIRARFGVEPGVLVHARGNTYRVHEVATAWEVSQRKPWLTGYLQRTDGSFSRVITHLYSDWLIIKYPEKE